MVFWICRFGGLALKGWVNRKIVLSWRKYGGIYNLENSECGCPLSNEIHAISILLTQKIFEKCWEKTKEWKLVWHFRIFSNGSWRISPKFDVLKWARMVLARRLGGPKGPPGGPKGPGGSPTVYGGVGSPHKLAKTGKSPFKRRVSGLSVSNSKPAPGGGGSSGVAANIRVAVRVRPENSAEEAGAFR